MGRSHGNGSHINVSFVVSTTIIHLRVPRSGDYPISSKSIKSGIYIVGTEPAIELGIDRNIYMEYGGNISFQRDDLQQAVKKIYLLLMGERKIVATYDDIVYFVFHTGMEPNAAVKVLEKALQDRQAVKCISPLPKVFFEYLLTSC